MDQKHHAICVVFTSSTVQHHLSEVVHVMQVWCVSGSLCQQMLNPCNYALLFLNASARHLASLLSGYDGMGHEVMMRIGQMIALNGVISLDSALGDAPRQLPHAG